MTATAVPYRWWELASCLDATTEWEQPFDLEVNDSEATRTVRRAAQDLIARYCARCPVLAACYADAQPGDDGRPRTLSTVRGGRLFNYRGAEVPLPKANRCQRCRTDLGGARRKYCDPCLTVVQHTEGPIRHGTLSGYNTHRSRGVPPTEDCGCLAAKRDYARASARRRRAA